MTEPERNSSSLSGSVTPWVLRAEAGPGRTLAAAVLDALDSAGPGPGVLVVLGGPTGAVPESALSELLVGPYGIGAVVPVIYDPETQAVVEAGVARTSQGLVPLGSGDDLRDPDHTFRRDVAGTTGVVAAFDASIVLEADLDEDEPSPAVTVEALFAAVRSLGRRVVLEPSWAVPDVLGAEARNLSDSGSSQTGVVETALSKLALRDAEVGTPVLVLTSRVPGLSVAEEPVEELVELLAQCPDVRVTLVCIDGFGQSRLRTLWEEQGVEVVAGPLDWSRWFDSRRYHFSHLIGTDLAVLSPQWGMARSAQPQAHVVLASEHLAFRTAQAVGSATDPQAREGLSSVVGSLRERVLDVIEHADAIWCNDPYDVALASGLCPDTRVTAMPRAVRALTSAKGFADRSGVVVVATENFDVAVDAEHAAVTVLERLVPTWRRRDPSLGVTVVCDWPTPRLVETAKEVGATIERSDGDLKPLLGRSRLVVAPHDHGLGAQGVIEAANATATPWLATRTAAAGWRDDTVGVVDDIPSMVTRGWELLSDEMAWTDLSEQIGIGEKRVAAEQASNATRALLAAGIAPATSRRWPARKRAPKPAVPPMHVPLRPTELSDVPSIDYPADLDETSRYALWHERKGPNADVVAALGAEAKSASYQPWISVLMPVHNTDPQMLSEAIDSVRAQVYPKWQLCMADDGSTNTETIALVRAAANSDHRIVLTTSETANGISEATNRALEMAEGEFVTFLDHDDVLKPHALAQAVRWLNADPTLDLIYSDEDKISEEGILCEPRFKPEWSPDLLLSQNYLCHMTVIRKSVVERLGGLRKAFDGSQDHDLVLRATDVTDRIAHIPEPLYSWRRTPGSTASAGEAKPWAFLAGQMALNDWLARHRIEGWAEPGNWPGAHTLRFALCGQPRVSIIIPTRNGHHLLKRCVDSVIERSTYRNYELVVIDNDSDDPQTLRYLATFPGRVLRYPHRFNYARQMNFAAGAVEADALLFLNNDTEVITPDWIERLLEHAMRPEVGAVGGRLYFGDGRVQHEGILLGMLRGHALNVDHGGYWALGHVVRDTSAVTGACTMIRPSVYWRVGGNDERLRIAYNDVDLCMRIRQAGYQIVYTPHAELYHHESSTRSGHEDPHDAPLFNERWRPKDTLDHYYSPQLDRSRRLFTIEP